MDYIVIGAGSIGTRHAGNLTALGASVTHIGWRACDLDTLHSRLAKDTCAVVIATATQIRLPIVRVCAATQTPMYIEKPVAFDPAELEQIYDAAAPVAGRSVAGFMMRYHPVMQGLATRDLSDCYSFDFEIGHDVRQWRQNWRFTDSYAAQAKGGGVLLDLCHELDMAHVLFPQARLSHVDCLGHAACPGVDVATRIGLTAPKGPVGTVAMDYLNPVSTRHMAIRGHTACADIDLLVPEERWSNAPPRRHSFDRNDMFRALMRDFMALATGHTPDTALLPRLDRVYAGCALIADAWAARQFRGTTTGGIL
ncbi:MAG: Gfo/Idh/MocA family protein [Paracoccaceae bacterium]